MSSFHSDCFSLSESGRNLPVPARASEVSRALLRASGACIEPNTVDDEACASVERKVCRSRGVPLAFSSAPRSLEWIYSCPHPQLEGSHS